MKIIIVATFFLQGLVLASAQTSAQAPSPGPAGPTNITAILSKAGQFTTFIRLIENTQVANQIDTQLNNSNNGLTVFAPTDNAFSNLKPGLLNTLSDQQKVQLVQFHILPNFMSLSQFQTASNPLRTQAGNANNGQFPLNVTTSGSSDSNNQVNITTGVVNATVSNSVYSDGQLAVYQVDQVLLPLEFFQSSVAPAPGPVAGKPKKKGAKASDSSNDDDTDASGAGKLVVQVAGKVVFAAVSIVAAFLMF